MLLVVVANIFVGHKDAWPEPLIDEPKHRQLPVQIPPKLFRRQAITCERRCVTLLLLKQRIDVTLIRLAISAVHDLLANKFLYDQTISDFTFRFDAYVHRLTVQKLR